MQNPEPKSVKFCRPAYCQVNFSTNYFKLRIELHRMIFTLSCRVHVVRHHRLSGRLQKAQSIIEKSGLKGTYSIEIASYLRHPDAWSRTCRITWTHERLRGHHLWMWGRGLRMWRRLTWRVCGGRRSHRRILKKKHFSVNLAKKNSEFGSLTGKKPGGNGPPGIPSFGGICPKGLGAGPVFCKKLFLFAHTVHNLVFFLLTCAIPFTP